MNTPHNHSDPVNDPQRRSRRLAARDEIPQAAASARDQQIIAALAAADFSDESRIRSPLRRELQSRVTGSKEFPMSMFTIRQAFLRTAFPLVIAALLLLAASSWGSSLAQSLVQVIERWQVGENTVAVSVDGAFEAVPDEAGEVKILPAQESPGSPSRSEFEIDPASGGPPHSFLEPLTDIEDAQSRLGFTLRLPAALPEGYAIQGITVIDKDQASVEFLNFAAQRLGGLLQTAVGDGRASVQVSFTSDMAVVETDVNGQAALWIAGDTEGTLVWETGGVNFQLSGLDNLDDALLVARSLE